jgi:DNA-binding CsgD family transcriptional regulator
MTMPSKAALDALTEKEKQTLRLIVRGHDAKSVAVTLGLSVHTINERLRDARRKLAVSSSREAARLLLDAETPENLGDTRIGDDADRAANDQEQAPVIGAGPARRRLPLLIGVMLMTFALGLLALTLLPGTNQAPPPPTTAPATPAPDAARQFLELVDAGRWTDSYARFGAAFRKLNSEAVWSEVSQRVRPPLGAVVSRAVLSRETIPVPPAGVEMLKFRTRFATGGEKVETVTLNQEGGDWKVVGVTIE